MPALKPSLKDDTIEVRPLGAAVTPAPVGVKRRLWTQTEVTSHSLVVLTPDRLYLAPLGGEPRPETVESIQSGGDVEASLGPLTTTIDLVGVRRVNLDLLTNSLVVEYVGRGLGTSRVTLTFATHESADACFTKLWRRLGEGMKLNDYQRDKWELARAPLMVLVASLLATAALAIVLSVFEDFASARAAAQAGVTANGPLGSPAEIPKTPLEGLIGWMNWKWVCGIGGTIAAASQVWLYRRLTTPPASLELVRGDG
jgi:hypothetical protein